MLLTYEVHVPMASLVFSIFKMAIPIFKNREDQVLLESLRPAPKALIGL